MVKYFGVVLLSIASLPAWAQCLTGVQLTQLNQQETNYMLGRIPPAFAHAVEDKLVTLDTKYVKDESCTARVILTMPEADLAEANRILDADIAKKIMLAGQGYGLPESTQLQADYVVLLDKMEPAEQEVLQTASLGKLRASVELMYAILTQARAEVKEGQQNTQAWQSDFKANYITSCQQTMTTTADNNPCACQARALEKIVSQRQLDHISYIKSNPYAMATGSDRAFNVLLEKLNGDCGLKNSTAG